MYHLNSSCCHCIFRSSGRHIWNHEKKNEFSFENSLSKDLLRHLSLCGETRIKILQKYWQKLWAGSNCFKNWAFVKTWWECQFYEITGSFRPAKEIKRLRSWSVAVCCRVLFLRTKTAKRYARLDKKALCSYWRQHVHIYCSVHLHCVIILHTRTDNLSTEVRCINMVYWRLMWGNEEWSTIKYYHHELKP